MTKQVSDGNGKPTGKSNPSPFLDSRQYGVEYLDGTTEILTTNTIAENIMSQVDEEGHQQLLLDKIVDHQKLDDVVNECDGKFHANRNEGGKTHEGMATMCAIERRII